MEEISRVLFLGVAVLAAVLLFTPYEAVLEGVVALAIVAAVLLGFFLHPRKEVYYVRTTRFLRDPDRNLALERDYLAVKVELEVMAAVSPHVSGPGFSGRVLRQGPRRTVQCAE